jgi:predicted GTPase
MNTQGTPHARSPWHLSTWSDYLIRFIHPKHAQVPVRMTRRQELLAAQDQKRREHRAHVLELLREVKEKNHHATAHPKGL